MRYHIGTQKFQEKYNVRLIERKDLAHGANVYFTFHEYQNK